LHPQINIEKSPDGSNESSMPGTTRNARRHKSQKVSPKHSASSRRSNRSILNQQISEKGLDEQMDDYMIADDSMTSPDVSSSSDSQLSIRGRNKSNKLGGNKGFANSPGRDSSSSSVDSGDFSSSDDSVNKDPKPEEQILNQMDAYYDLNFKDFMVASMTDYVKTQIWNVVYDLNFDYIYVF